MTGPALNWPALLPLLVMGGGGLIVLGVSPVRWRGRADLPVALSLATVLATGLAIWQSWSAVGGVAPGPAGSRLLQFNDMLVLDSFALFLGLVIVAGTALTILLSVGRAEAEEAEFPEYYALLLFSTCGMLVLAASNDLMMIFLSIEFTSIPVYILAGLARRRLVSNEASLKYFLLGAFATAFLLYGIALVYGGTGTTKLGPIAQTTQMAGPFTYSIMLAGLGLILVGLGLKAALAPFHFWAPDVYEGAPTPVTAFMSAGPKIAVFAALVRLLGHALWAWHQEWSDVVWALAALTMTIGNVVALAQVSLKRMLAYSSIAHAGYVMVGLLAGGSLSVQSISFYLAVYTLANLGAFAVVIVLDKGNSGPNLKDFTGLGFSHPLQGLAMTFFMISLAGIPPAAGFMGKLYLFGAAVNSGYYGLAVLGVLNSVVSVYYYLRVVVLMYMRAPADAELRPPALANASAWIGLAVLICAAGTILLGVWPGPLWDLAGATVIAAAH